MLNIHRGDDQAAAHHITKSIPITMKSRQGENTISLSIMVERIISIGMLTEHQLARK